MKTIAYNSPFVPPEWIAAHGLRPHWLRLSAARPVTAAGRGICPYAGALIDAALAGIDAAALVLSTACDQMRYAAAMVVARGRLPMFLLNVPSTWQTAAVHDLYRAELQRLGRFLVEMDGHSPDKADLARVMLAYDHARLAVRKDAAGLSARQFATALAELHGSLAAVPEVAIVEQESTVNSRRPTAAGRSAAGAGVPLAILGGPLLEADYEFFDLVEHCGGRVALDATEGGERTMPRRFDPARAASDPMQELADAYFDTIPDAFRRPNSGLYEWLARELPARDVRGIIFRRFAWCDLWHAELQRLKEWTPLPVLEIDAGPDDAAAPNRVEGRIEAFLEMLK